MTKYVHDTKAGRSLSAWIVLKNGKHIATVRMHFSDGGTTTVNVYHLDGATEFQHAKASGHGYDKTTAALAGLKIDGHELTDHCAGQLSPPDGHQVWPRDSKPPAGYIFANFHAEFHTFGFNPEKHRNPNFCGEEGYSSCYREAGLKYLEAVGYTVIQAL